MAGSAPGTLELVEFVNDQPAQDIPVGQSRHDGDVALGRPPQQMEHMRWVRVSQLGVPSRRPFFGTLLTALLAATSLPPDVRRRSLSIGTLATKPSGAVADHAAEAHPADTR